MVVNVFLMAALSLQPLGAQGYQIDTAKAVEVIRMAPISDAELAERLKKVHDFEDVYLHERPQVEKLKEYGYEKYPALHGNKEIWIKRKPATDSPKQRAIGAAA